MLFRGTKKILLRTLYESSLSILEEVIMGFMDILKNVFKESMAEPVCLCKVRRMAHIRMIQGFCTIICGKFGHRTIGRRMMWQKKSELHIRRSRKWREGGFARMKGLHN